MGKQIKKFSTEAIILDTRISPDRYDLLVVSEYRENLWRKIVAKYDHLLSSIVLMSTIVPGFVTKQSQLSYLGVAGIITIVATGMLFVQESRVSTTERLRKQSYTGSVSFTKKAGDLTADNSINYDASDGAVIEDGDIISTASDNRATVVFENGDLVRLDYNSSIQVGQASSESLSLQLNSGQIYIKASDDKSKINITTQYGHYASEKGSFIVISNENEDGVLVLLEEVIVSTKDNDDLFESVKEGHSYFIMNSAESQFALGLDPISPIYLEGSSFIAWNLTEEQKSRFGGERMGVLAQLTFPDLTVDSHIYSEPSNSVSISGKTSVNSSVVVNGVNTNVNNEGLFTQQVPVENGVNKVEIVATDDEGKSNSKVVEVLKPAPTLPIIKANMASAESHLVLKWEVVSGDINPVTEWRVIYGTNPNPVENNSVIRIRSKSTMEFNIPVADGLTYYARVCAYAQSEDLGTGRCIAYSDIVSMSAPTIKVLLTSLQADHTLDRAQGI